MHSPHLSPHAKHTTLSKSYFTEKRLVVLEDSLQEIEAPPGVIGSVARLIQTPLAVFPCSQRCIHYIDYTFPTHTKHNTKSSFTPGGGSRGQSLLDASRILLSSRCSSTASSSTSHKHCPGTLWRLCVTSIDVFINIHSYCNWLKSEIFYFLLNYVIQ